MGNGGRQGGWVRWAGKSGWPRGGGQGRQEREAVVGKEVD